MWSLGCLTTALLNGHSYFVNSQNSSYRHDSSAAVTKASAECDLTGIDDALAWKDVTVEAKDFIKKLLKLDEKARLNTDEALEHVWFTKGSRREIIQNAYKNAINGWTASRPGWDFIEDINSLMQIRNPPSEQVPLSSQTHTQHHPINVPSYPIDPNYESPHRRLEDPISSTYFQPPVSQGLPAKRHNRTPSPDPRVPDEAEAAIYDEAGRENRGFVSAKAYGEMVARKRAKMQAVR